MEFNINLVEININQLKDWTLKNLKQKIDLYGIEKIELENSISITTIDYTVHYSDKSIKIDLFNIENLVELYKLLPEVTINAIA